MDAAHAQFVDFDDRLRKMLKPFDAKSYWYDHMDYLQRNEALIYKEACRLREELAVRDRVNAELVAKLATIADDKARQAQSIESLQKTIDSLRSAQDAIAERTAELARGYWPIIYVYRHFASDLDLDTDAKVVYEVTTVKKDIPAYQTLAGIFEDLRDESVEIYTDYRDDTFYMDSEPRFISTTRTIE